MRRVTGSLIVRLGGALLCAAGAAVPVAQPAGAQDRVTTHRVVIERFRFEPATLRIRQGDMVIWVNRDVAPHTATDAKRLWATAPLDRNATGRITFAKLGSFAYYCQFHPHMRGTVIVVGR